MLPGIPVHCADTAPVVPPAREGLFPQSSKGVDVHWSLRPKLFASDARSPEAWEVAALNGLPWQKSVARLGRARNLRRSVFRLLPARGVAVLQPEPGQVGTLASLCTVAERVSLLDFWF